MPEHNHLFVDGWFAPPAYDESLRSLTWALLLHDNTGEQLINYNIRFLTREGYISAILVSHPDTLAADRQVFEREILPGLTVNQGKTYEDFNPATDKKSSFGLTGLILGGAGVALAKKTGIIAIIALIAKKFWIILFAPIIWLFSKLGRKRKSNNENSISPESPEFNANTYSDPNTDSRFKSKFDLENENKKPPTNM
ncbi:hypothetical protein D3C78_1434010 [compost metagenome]